MLNNIVPYFRVSKKAAALSVVKFITANPGCHRQQPANVFTQLCQNAFTKTRTGRSAASFVRTSANITLAQPVLPAIDSKTFTDYGPLLPLSLVRTVPLSPDSVKRWAHFHRDGSLGAWSCLSDIIAQMFDKVNLTPGPKWVWEINFKKFLIFYCQVT